jgi:protein involved in polysaccharide export with SLBB domain
LGIINAAGKTYRQLKTEAEAIVSNNYPLSGVQLVLTQVASFNVYITGEVQALAERQIWALDRLSVLVNAAGLTAYSSRRDITIISSSGQSRTYDLFKAQRYGDLSQDPCLRPGDTIRINRADRTVAVQGQVERPGKYQLLPGENLSELIIRYASGFTPVADISRIELVRYVDAETDSGDKVYLSEKEMAANYPLKNLDLVTVPSIVDLVPVMFVEGAVVDITVAEGETQGSLVASQTNASNRITVRFNQGENYASLVQRNRNWFTAISDTQNAYIIRGEERIPLNINPMLYDSKYRSQYFVERNDVLIIPFRQYFVTVAGAVVVPGRYPYIPDRAWDYYVALAGGFYVGRNSFESVVIKDINGKRMKKEDPITPETIITARTNSGLFYFNQYAPVITTVFSLIVTLFTVQSLIQRQ